MFNIDLNCKKLIVAVSSDLMTMYNKKIAKDQRQQGKRWR